MTQNTAMIGSAGTDEEPVFGEVSEVFGSVLPEVVPVAEDGFLSFDVVEVFFVVSVFVVVFLSESTFSSVPVYTFTITVCVLSAEEALVESPDVLDAALAESPETAALEESPV